MPRKTVLLYSIFSAWFLVFLALAMAASFAALLAGFVFGLRQKEVPALSWLYMAIGGIVAHYVLRVLAGIVLVVLKDPPLPVVWFWVAIMVIAAVVGPDALKDLMSSLGKN